MAVYVPPVPDVDPKMAVPPGVVEYSHWYDAVAPDGESAPAVSVWPTWAVPVIAPIDVSGIGAPASGPKYALVGLVDVSIGTWLPASPTASDPPVQTPL